MKDNLKGYYKEFGVFHNWEELQDAFEKNCKYNEKFQWIFRGQPEGGLGLTTVLDRLFEKIEEKGKDIKDIDKKKIELGLLRMFMRRYYQFGDEATPEEKDIPSWLSLMRHYGAPTRLLDWTWSFNVATFFALEKIEAEDDIPCEVWAANLHWLENERLHAHDLFPGRMKTIFQKVDRNLKQLKNFRKFLKKPAILPLTPYHLNKRLAIQQGLFLMSCDVAKNFSKNLIAHGGGKKDECKKHLIKFKIANTIDTKKEIMWHLHKMNMSRTVLYPGLDGFAQSLKNFLFFMPEILNSGNLYSEFYPY